MLADLAVIGPVETDAPPLVLSQDVVTAVGSPVYLIGYPGESEVFPQPTLATGLLSNIRRWPAADLTYYQTDASTVGGWPTACDAKAALGKLARRSSRL